MMTCEFGVSARTAQDAPRRVQTRFSVRPDNTYDAAAVCCMALISCTVPPTTPRRYAAHPSPFASPSTPRFANEIRSRFQMQTSVTLTISAFCSLLTKLNASYADDGEYLGSGGRVTEQTRLERIESFREDYMLGALTTVRPPPALLANDDSETFSDGTRRSSGDFTSSGASDLTSSPTPLPHRPRYVPPNAVERGILAEKTIKADLMRRGALLVHADFESLPRIAQKARRKTVRSGKPVYVSPGLITSPSWASEYFANGWARPGLRWSSFKPDLIRFEAIKTKVDEEPCVTFEVVEIKYRAPGARETIFSSWKVQAVYCECAGIQAPDRGAEPALSQTISPSAKSSPPVLVSCRLIAPVFGFQRSRVQQCTVRSHWRSAPRSRSSSIISLSCCRAGCTP